MACRTLTFPEEDSTLVTVSTRFSDDLPAHIKGRAYWVSYDHLAKSQYHIALGSGGELPVKFINHRWYIIRWDEDGQYYTKSLWRLPIGEHGLGWYKESDPQHPDYQHPSPLDARVTSDPGTSTTEESPQD